MGKYPHTTIVRNERSSDSLASLLLVDARETKQTSKISRPYQDNLEHNWLEAKCTICL